jgi:hypothetical protein
MFLMDLCATSNAAAAPKIEQPHGLSSIYEMGS